ncbi:MAG: small basic protein [Candidatus Omnitrophota bacterium]
MSMHPSLAGTEKGKKQRAVLKRVERIKWLAEKAQWKEGDKVYGLAKIKAVRIKIKKEKAEKAADAAAPGAAPAGAAAAAKGAAPAAKGAAPAKDAKK